MPLRLLRRRALFGAFFPLPNPHPPTQPVLPTHPTLYPQATHLHLEAAALIRARGGTLGLCSARTYLPPPPETANNGDGGELAAGGPGGAAERRDAGTLMCRTCAEGDVRLLSSLLACGLGAAGLTSILHPSLFFPDSFPIFSQSSLPRCGALLIFLRLVSH